MKDLVNGLIMIAFLSTAAVTGALEWPALLGDHMVLQQKQPVALWGKAAPGEQITLNASWGAKAAAVAGTDGVWRARLQTPSAGGPYSLTASTASGSKTFKDILIGEVWLCSGQSNMEMPLAGWPPGDPIANSEAEIAAADNPQIRLFTVDKATSATPLSDCRGEWQVCSPATAASFSATAYFFGRTLQKELNTPIGLIHSSWGGTPAEAWTSAECLKTMPEYARVLDQITESQAAMKARQQWLEGHPAFSVTDKPASDRFIGLDFGDDICCAVGLDDAKWGRMTLPVAWENTEMGQFDGVVWFRKTVEVPADWVGRNLVVELGPIDDMDVAWFNGERIGGMEQPGLWQAKRIYKVASELVRPGRNLIAVRVIDTQGGGGLYGGADQLKLYPEDNPEGSLSLAGEWRFLPVAEYQNSRFYQLKVAEADFFSRPKVTVEISANTPTFLYNAMIAPLVPYTIRGAIWYQGESNAGRPREYRTLFPLMIDCWRQQWGGKPFPFYFVQIAPYDYGVATRSQELREAQMLTLRHPRTGMAVTLDIAAPSIHPPNKQEVGKRLALWALAKDYGRKLVCSGPIYKKMAVKGNKIILSFDYTGSGLKAGSAGLTGFEIAGADQHFVPAQATLSGKRVVVSSPQVSRPVAVRYAWSNLATASLFNLENLPASSFRTDDWK
ncbi:MAG TPA: sialate O-acetylesterase [bacterium]|nr:sialate O-acetylesterase [bacterium]HQI47038.1 sialate O-acetylesterase [bacterium]HQJ65723.1 sialate O-acetylesterase [bacterium]